MKVAQIRTLLESYPDKQLREIIVALYKAMPKTLKEDHQIDELLKNPDEFLGKKKQLKKKARIPDINSLEFEIEEFLVNAYDQNYLAPNRIVPKSERPKWRFKVNRFYKDLILAASAPENMPKAAGLMQKIYEMLCYACAYILFSAYDVFESVRISQTDFFKQILTLKFQFQEKKDFIRDSIKLLIGNQLNRYTLYEDLMEELITFLKTPDLKEMTIQQCRVEIENTGKQLANPQKGKKKNDFFSFDSHKYDLEKMNNNLTILGFLCYIRLSEYDNAIKFFNTNYLESDKEVSLYVLLRLLFAYNLKDQWLRVYESAVKSKIKPRKNLVEVYHHLQKSDKLPDYM